ncbi:restriction endonuclease subunit S [Escherichia coli]|uniref:restriction endonuclease subunit S n=1 Tax=Escherichia coli TaxID=562 RepID=UPI00178E58AB|nr:restriction endonuclease subunit S [Escherichia coli]EFT1004563.1 restriction endonuclease subunit S [Shigella sonnei]EEV5609092.1 restriction endonuclease subunit S [Escherichia coli]EEW0992845.1 restriction endonuclease subunit S [Escherichia coli]EFB5147863.1 restriction endonuclease subunit S [Escherichia coli]EFC9832260.1 restriction endonuclease subunit S [Escherichia coli]
MSELSYLEKLLDGVVVEWVPVSELFQIKNGYTPSKSKKEFWENGTIPWFRLEDVRVNGRELNDSIQHINPLGVKGCLFPKNSIFMSTTATIGEYALVRVPYLTNQQITNFSISEKFSEAVNIKYIFYRFYDFGKWCTENANKSGGVSIIGLKKLSQYQFPIPCPDNPEKSLAIQSEIVRILDKFTALTAELTAELNMRKKQYNYYRDQLLSFNTEDVPHLPMGQKDIGEFIRGGTFQKKDFIDAGVGCIHYGQIYTYYGTYTEKTKTYISTALAKKCKKAQKGDLIIATTSENDEDVCKAVAWLGSEDIAVSSDACIYKHNLNPKYVSYFFQTEQFQNQKRQYITGAKVRRVNADNLSKILIPVPSMEIQERIVSILDKFDTLTNSITEGLPREIELRQKQYEYYRDLLFSFPKPETASN